MPDHEVVLNLVRQETWTGRSVIADLSILFSWSPRKIASRIGKRTLLVPMASIADLVGAAESELGTRRERLQKFFAKLRSLFYEHGVGMNVVDVYDCKVRYLPVPRFLDLGHDRWIEHVEQRSIARRDELVQHAKGFEAAIREHWNIPIEGMGHRAFELIVEPSILAALRCWANGGQHESVSKLPEWMAGLLKKWRMLDNGNRYERSMDLVNSVRFLRHYGRINDQTLPREARLIGDFHDAFYVTWAVWMRCQLWTNDKALRTFCAMVKQVQRRLPSDLFETACPTPRSN